MQSGHRYAFIGIHMFSDVLLCGLGVFLQVQSPRWIADPNLLCAFMSVSMLMSAFQVDAAVMDIITAVSLSLFFIVCLATRPFEARLDLILQELDLFVAVGAIIFSRVAATAVAHGEDPASPKFIACVALLMIAVVVVSALNLVGLVELVKDEYGETIARRWRKLRGAFRSRFLFAAPIPFCSRSFLPLQSHFCPQPNSHLCSHCCAGAC